MTIEDIKDINKSVKDCSLYYGHVNYTYLLRNIVISKIRNNKNIGNHPVKLNKMVIKYLLEGIFLKSHSFFTKYDSWVFSNSERRKLLTKKYIDRVASIVSSDKNQSCLFIENPSLVGHKQPTDDIIFSEAVFLLLSYIFSILFFRKRKINIDTSKLIELEEKYNIKINFQPQLRRVIGQYFCLKFILKFRKPKQVFIVYPSGYYGYILALKEKKIPIIELQHGIIYELHPSYNNYVDDDFLIFKPDYILTYGDRDRRCLVSLKYLDQNHIFPIGNYMLWLYKQTKTENSSYLKNILSKVPSSKKIIAVTCTVNDLELFIDLIKEINNIDNSFYFLLVPRIENNIPLDSSIGVIVNPSKTNIYEIIKCCNIHLTQVSTCALEALYFSKRSLIYEPNNVDESFFKKNYKDVKLDFFSCAKEFINITKQNIPIDINDIDNLFVDDIDIRFLKFMTLINN
ncbi:MAG: hypothetical protein ACK5KL_18455 [Dysgonomonas sp.]